MSRDLRLLAGAVFLSSAGDLLALIVLALYVHELTGSGLAVSALVATTLVPVVALAPLAGLAADRFESVRLLVIASLAQALVAAALAFSGDLAAILALSALLTAGNAFAQPAEFALTPAVAGSRPVSEVTGVLEAARYAGFAAGPALAAGLGGARAPAGAAGQRRELRGDRGRGGRLARPPRAGGGDLARAAAGARRLPAPAPRPCVAGDDRRRGRRAAVHLGLADRRDLLPQGRRGRERHRLRAADLRLDGRDGVRCDHARPPRPGGLLAGGALVALAVQGAGMGLQTAWAVLPVAFAGYVIGGLGHGVKNVLLRALLTARVPEALHGRAFAAYNAARNTAELGAVGAGGVLVTALGPRAALLLAGLGPVLAAAAGLAALRRRVGSNEPVPAHQRSVPTVQTNAT